MLKPFWSNNPCQSNKKEDIKMRKIIMLCLSLIIVLSGCITSYNAVPNPAISESLVSRMKNNADTHSIEGFTAQSTFGDVLEKIGPENISQASLSYNTEFLGYSAVMGCVFDNYKSKLRLEFMEFSIYPDGDRNGYESKLEELVAKLDAEFGSHEYTDEYDSDDYYWRVNNWHIDLSAYEEVYEQSGKLAFIWISPGTVLFGILPQTPDVCPYKFGEDIGTVYSGETPAALPDSFDYNCYLEYTDDGIEINLNFETDDTGVKLREGRYDINLNDMGFEDSLDYFETLADGLEEAMGAPLSRGFGIPDVDMDNNEITGMTHETGAGGQGMSAQDILNSGKKYYWLDMNWPGVSFNADYCMGVSMDLDFTEGYFGGTANE